MNSSRIAALVRKDLKHSIREPATLFMLLLFPLIITIVFGLAFGGIDTGGNSAFNVGVVNLDNESVNAQWADSFVGNLTELNGTVVIHYDSNATAQADLMNGQLDALVVIPVGFGDSCASYWNAPLSPDEWVNTTIGLYVDSGSMVAGSAIPPMVLQVLLTTLYGAQAMSLEIPIDLSNPAFVTVSDLTMWDYMAPGIFAFAAIFMIMNVAQTMTTDRDGGILKRMATTPVTATEFILSKTISNMVVAVGQVAIVFASAYAIGYRPDTDLAGVGFAFLIVSVFAITCVGLGLLTAVMSKSADLATGLAFIFIMPQMLFGTYMQLGGFGEAISAFMPSNYVTHALTTLFLRGAPVTAVAIWIDLFIVLIVGIAVLAAGIALFSRSAAK